MRQPCRVNGPTPFTNGESALLQDGGTVHVDQTYCRFCTKTKAQLTELGAKFDVVELDEVEGGSEQQDALEDLTGQSTVPNVFVGGKSIGGISDVRKLHKAGDLEPLLKQSGAL